MSEFQKSIKNRTIFCGDNIDVLRGFNDKSVDLIYLDPPFNKKKQFIAPIGSSSEGASFKDYWELEDIKNAWLADLKENHKELYSFIELSQYIGDKSNKYYLVYMAVRLLELKRILKDSGSIYLHCDATMSHFLKLLMDVIFGANNFMNEIIWHYFKPHGGSHKNYPRNYDNIIFYKNGNNNYFNYESSLLPYDEKAIKRYDKVDDEGRRYKIYNNKDGSTRISYMKEGGKSDNVWDIPFVQGTSKERTGYPTQKPLSLLERIIATSCPHDGIVLDPFCGCATTCIASERLGRQWVGIDISKMAFQLVQDRLKKEVELEGTVASKLEELTVTYREDIPLRTDLEVIKLTGKVRTDIKKYLYGEQAGNCNGCKQHFRIESLEIDHIIPKAKGGQDNEENLQLLCSYCNRVKGDRDMAYLRSKLSTIVID